MKRLVLTLGFISIAFLVGCASAGTQGAAGNTPTIAPAGAAAGSKNPVAGAQGWQQEWDRVQQAARKEGSVVIPSNIGPTVRQALSQAMKDKYGVEIEFVTGRPAEFGPKILAERRAGLYLQDLMIGGAGTGLDTLKPAGVLDPLDPVIFLPEALDDNAWYAGKPPWIDKDHYILSFIAGPQAPVFINTGLVKKDEIKSYRDLLDPKWKGKLLLGDPTVGGSGNGFFSALAEGIMSLDFLRQLAKQEPLISKDERLMGEWVAHGKYPVAMAISADNTTEFIAAGAPVDAITPVEGTYTSASTGSVLMLKNPPHPNAAKLVANWLLTKEGGYIFAKAFGTQSARVDVPADFLPPSRVRQSGVKYVSTDNEEYIAKKNEYLKTAKQIFGDLMK